MVEIVPVPLVASRVTVDCAKAAEAARAIDRAANERAQRMTQILKKGISFTPRKERAIERR